ncbi:MAG: KH domain-containing protein [Candidatus Hydrogenedentota bacterium]|nr:MAG: KH domain-containing protein [Candidatus Hydrogenedentota bacterium]
MNTKELIEYVAKELVEKAEAVEVKEIKGVKSVIYELTCDPSDMGRVIGKDGRIIKALRTLVKAIASRRGGETVELEVID